jgi:hypothetical protein
MARSVIRTKPKRANVKAHTTYDLNAKAKQKSEKKWRAVYWVYRGYTVRGACSAVPQLGLY